LKRAVSGNAGNAPALPRSTLPPLVPLGSNTSLLPGMRGNRPEAARPTEVSDRPLSETASATRPYSEPSAPAWVGAMRMLIRPGPERLDWVSVLLSAGEVFTATPMPIGTTPRPTTSAPPSTTTPST
jgi:hypothetical protein